MTASNPWIDRLSERNWSELEQVIDRFERAWRQGQIPCIDEHLPQEPVQRLALLIELVRIDREFRFRTREVVHIETYLERYPELVQNRAELEMLVVEREKSPEGIPKAPIEPLPDPGATNYKPGDPDTAAEKPIPLGPRPRHFQPGPFGPYDLLEEIARGGMGVVYKARQRRSGRIVALKRLLDSYLAAPESVERFQREARAAAELDHVGIVPIYDIGEVEGHFYFTMPFVSGGSLQQALAQGPLPAKVAARLVQQVAEAVQHAHNKCIIHRDIKPHNILLQCQDGAVQGSLLHQADTDGAVPLPTPRLSDFGLARAMQETGLTQTGAIMGTPSYMAPEQAAGQRQKIGPRSDVYSLGAVLYCLLTGQPPFKSDSGYETIRQVREEAPVPPRQLNPSIPQDLEAICLKCLAKDPESRYSAAAELGDDIGRWFRGEAVKAWRDSPKASALEQTADNQGSSKGVVSGESRSSGGQARASFPPLVRQGRSRRLWWLLMGVGASLLVAIVAIVGWRAAFGPSGPIVNGTEIGKIQVAWAPPRFILEDLQDPANPNRIVKPDRFEDGQPIFDKPLPTGRWLVRGRLECGNDDDPLLNEPVLFRTSVNNFEQFDASLEHAVGLDRKFTALIRLNQENDNKVVLRFDGPKLPRTLEFKVNCEKPERRQRLHLVLVSPGHTDQDSLRQEVLDAFQAKNKDEKRFQNKDGDQFHTGVFIEGRIIVLPTYVAPGEFGARLEDLNQEIKELRRKKKDVNDVIIVYFRGKEAVEPNAQYLLTEGAEKRGDWHKKAIDCEMLRLRLADFVGAKLIILDVTREGNQPIQPGRIADWQTTPGVGVLRYVSLADRKTPEQERLLTVLGDSLKSAGLLGKVRKDLDAQVQKFSENRPGLFFDWYVPEALDKLWLGDGG